MPAPIRNLENPRISLATIVVSALTLIATIIGWFFTHKKQKEILVINRIHSVTDREIEAFREKVGIIGEVTKTLNALAHAFLRMAVLAKVKNYDHIIPISKGGSNTARNI